MIKEILDFKEDADYKRLSVDEISILRDYISKYDKEIKRLRKYEQFIDSVIITPVDFNNEDGNYQLHNWTKQDLYKRLFWLRDELIHEQWDGKVFKDENN